MSAIHTINGKEIVAYGDMFEYVEDADLSAYEYTGFHQKDHMVKPVVLIEDSDFFSGDEIVLNDGRSYTEVRFGEDDDRKYYVDSACIDDEVYIIYVWNENRSMYVAFDGSVHASEGDAQAKIKEIENRNDVVWEVVNDGHHTMVQSCGVLVDVLLRVGHGLPTHWNVIGCAELSIAKQGSPTIVQRLNFSAHPDRRGEVTGEFYNTDGITEDCGDTWDVDTVKMHDPAVMDIGDERNDDIMKQFIEKYVSRLDYVDELHAAQADNFCVEED